MTTRLLLGLSTARVDTYRNECARLAAKPSSAISLEQIAALYTWQTAVGAAWFENLSYLEATVRHATDDALRTRNRRLKGTDDWLQSADNKLAPLVLKAKNGAIYRAGQTAMRRPPGHPRRNAPVTLDDLVSQLTFGNITHVMNTDPPIQRSNLQTGYSKRENLWLDGLKDAFPNLTLPLAQRWATALPTNVPADVVPGYAVGQALDRLGRLRNRIGHHEQILNVNHSRLRKDVAKLLNAVNPGALNGFKRIDRLPRILAMKPVL